MENELYKLYKEQIIPYLKKETGYANIHQIPKLEKVVINSCVSAAGETKAALEETVKEIAAITGQRPVQTRAKKSISNFKLRKGQAIGAKVTLRGDRMYEFLQRLLLTAMPRIRDFRGVSPHCFDGNGNYTVGIKDHTIFPEIDLDRVNRTVGMDITFVTTATNDKDARLLLEAIGVPFSDKKHAARSAAAEENPAEAALEA